jgi:hypothetical protein
LGGIFETGRACKSVGGYLRACCKKIHEILS